MRCDISYSSKGLLNRHIEIHHTYNCFDNTENSASNKDTSTGPSIENDNESNCNMHTCPCGHSFIGSTDPTSPYYNIRQGMAPPCPMVPNSTDASTQTNKEKKGIN